MSNPHAHGMRQHYWSRRGLWLAAFISVFPFYWMIVGATNTANDITGGKATFGSASVRQHRQVL